MTTVIARVTATLALVLLIPAVARAALVDEQHQGQSLVSQLKASTRSCKDLSAVDLDHIGEYVMVSALGSTSLHQAMNDRMTAMMGEQAESRMHQLLGARYAGCSTHGLGIIGAGSMMSGGMMDGYYNNGGWSTMMRASNWSWMTGGTWQRMTRQSWNRLQHRLLGNNVMGSTGGRSTLAIICATLGGVLLFALLIVVAISIRAARRPPSPTPPTALH